MTLLLFFLLLPLSCLGDSTNESMGVVLAGGTGHHNHGDSVEFWSPDLSCSLPTLTREMSSRPSLDFVSGKLVVCFHTGCDVFTGTTWEPLQDTWKDRWEHGSAVINDFILLVGGFNARNSTERMPVDGGESKPGYSFKPGREKHCLIKTGASSIVLTGGLFYDDMVTEHSGLGPGDEMITRELPSLIQARDNHACGMYQNAGKKMLIVSGGQKSGRLDSTEVLDYSLGTKGAWREVAPLPAPREGLSGASIDGVFHVLGGWGEYYFSQILQFDPVTETWNQEGSCIYAGWNHGIAEVPQAAVEEYCIDV